MTEKYIALAVLAFFVYMEFFHASPTNTAVSTPLNSLDLPQAPLNASTLTPAQLGTGLFEDESGLGSQYIGDI